MPKEYARSERLASQIQRELARLVQNGLKDPRVSMTSILEVQLSKDLSHAKVFFSVLDPDDAGDCLTALTNAHGFLQREIGKTLKSRVTPKLNFVYDDTDIRGRRMSDLIDSALARDRKKSSD